MKKRQLQLAFRTDKVPYDLEWAVFEFDKEDVDRLDEIVNQEGLSERYKAAFPSRLGTINWDNVSLIVTPPYREENESLQYYIIRDQNESASRDTDKTE